VHAIFGLCNLIFFTWSKTGRTEKQKQSYTIRT